MYRITTIKADQTVSFATVEADDVDEVVTTIFERHEEIVSVHIEKIS